MDKGDVLAIGFGLIIIGSIFLLLVEVSDNFDDAVDRLNFCHSQGYDGYADIGSFARTEYVCFKDVDGFREYSGVLAD